jgi:hypothetical protein
MFQTTKQQLYIGLLKHVKTRNPGITDAVFFVFVTLVFAINIKCNFLATSEY